MADDTAETKENEGLAERFGPPAGWRFPFFDPREQGFANSQTREGSIIYHPTRDDEF